jgi:signal transduction histidine kinase
VSRYGHAPRTGAVGTSLSAGERAATVLAGSRAALTTPAASPPWGRSLSARLLLLTTAFLLVGEILIFLPSIARFRQVYLEERIAAAHLATIGLAHEGEQPNSAVEDALLTHAGVLSVTVARDQPVLMLGLEAPVDATFQLGGESWVELILAAMETLRHGGQRVIRVVGPAPMAYGTTIAVTLTEVPLHAAMTDYAWRILLLSLVLSAIVAALLFIALRQLIVRPLTQITERLARFREQPADESVDRAPSPRRDEIGIVDREFDAMTRDLRQALAQKTRLAALGEAVSKLNHDLRNILSTALLVSDRLERSQDPAVQAVAPKLIQTLERAIRLCQGTLDFARSRPPRPKLGKIALRPLIDEVIGALEVGSQPVELINEVAPGISLRADADQLHRLFLNLARNALQAMPEGGRLAFRSRRSGGLAEIDVTDTGPGLPRAARERLFEPFAASTSTSGAGLGLAISREIARAHGGDLRLLATGPGGTTFTLQLPIAARRVAA